MFLRFITLSREDIATLDRWGHKLRLPRWIMKPICDWYDITQGIPKEDLIYMDYNGKAPWWLR